MSSPTARSRGRGGWLARVLGDRRSPAPPGSGALGLGIFLASLAMLFAGSIVAFFVVRHRAPEWPPPGAPPIPPLLWLSTAVLLASSASIQWALAAIRRGDQRRLMHGLRLTAILALLFLALQAVAWGRFFQEATFYGSLYGFTFYLLTGLHAAHVVGGIVGLTLVIVRAGLGHYSWAFYPGVRYVAIYWHFLDGVWLTLFVILELTS